MAKSVQMTMGAEDDEIRRETPRSGSKALDAETRITMKVRESTHLHLKVMAAQEKTTIRRLILDAMLKQKVISREQYDRELGIDSRR